MERIKKWATLLAINVAILLFILFTIELAVHIAFPEITTLSISKNLFEKNKYGVTYGLKHNVVEKVYGVYVTTDNIGFRIDTTLRKIINEDTLPKILILGDSVAFGIGVEDEFILSSILMNS